MLSGAEKKYLAMTIAFLLLGAGLKAYRRSQTSLGPFSALLTGVVHPDSAQAANHYEAPPMASSSAHAPDTLRPVLAAFEAPTKTSPAPHRKKTAAPKAKHESAVKKLRPGEKLDPNLARLEELAALPGVGSKTALAIVTFRETQGKFLRIDDLLQVKGIGAKKLQALRSNLELSGETVALE